MLKDWTNFSNANSKQNDKVTLRVKINTVDLYWSTMKYRINWIIFISIFKAGQSCIQGHSRLDAQPSVVQIFRNRKSNQSTIRSLWSNLIYNHLSSKSTKIKKIIFVKKLTSNCNFKRFLTFALASKISFNKIQRLSSLFALTFY